MEAHPEARPRLSSTEATVVATLLGASLETEGDRISRSGIPRSTFQDAKKRVYARGVVEDRYVPDPPVFGTRWATAILARPFAEETGSLVERWTRHRNAVVVWQGLHVVFGVFLHAEPRLSGAEAPSEPASEGSPRTSMTVDLTAPSVPIFFDFEGAWANLIGASTLWKYPRPLVGRPSPEGPRASEGSRRIATMLVDRTSPPIGSYDDRAPHRMGPYALPRSARRLVQQGWLQWRTFPRLDLLELTEGRVVESVVLVVGLLRPEQAPATLFRELVVRRSFPFLLMTDGSRALLGFLSSRATGGSSSTVGGAAEVLTRSLSQIETYREPVRDLREVVAHRYGSVVGSA